MDFLPIKPSSTNKVNTAINLANDGGSKSNTGYISKRGGKKEKEEKGASVDELSLSTAAAEPEENEDTEQEVTGFLNLIKNFFKNIKNFFLKLFGLNRPRLENIYEDSNVEIS